MKTGQRKPLAIARLASPLLTLLLLSCAADGSKPAPLVPGSAVGAPPPRTGLSDGAYCLLPSEDGFKQISCATGEPFPNGSILADGSKVCFEIDKGTRKLLPIPCGGPAMASAPAMRAPSILPPAPRPAEKPIEASGKWCTYETSEGLRMLAECSKIKAKAPPKPETTLRLCERVVDGLRYVVPCELARPARAGRLCPGG